MTTSREKPFDLQFCFYCGRETDAHEFEVLNVAPSSDSNESCDIRIICLSCKIEKKALQSP